MKALLLIAHGSRREASNEEVRALAATLAGQSGEAFGAVVPAFLELAEPSIPGGVAECVRLGATEVQALPYFLSAGRHVVQDIPAALEQAASEHPGIGISVSPYLGQHPMISQLLLGLAHEDASVTDAA